jgi:ABC-type transport system involved in multi-copper enzyme maturation permease subunit
MSATLSRGRPPVLLNYRPWRGRLGSPHRTVWPIARTALGLMFRNKLFWALYGLGLMFFLLFFFGQYLMVQLEIQMGSSTGAPNNLRDWMGKIRELLKLDGSGESYRIYFGMQGYMVMIILALAGAMLVGNDIRFGSLPFYLSKPISRFDYLSGKALAVAVFVNMMTTIPAVVLYIQYSLLEDKENYFVNKWYLLLGICAYGAVLTMTLSLLLLATALWLKRTVPMIMVWTTLFLFCRVLADKLVVELHGSPFWRLIDLWNDTVLVGNACLGVDALDRTQPEWYWAALVLGAVSLTCLIYLILRIRAVEVVK